MIDIRDFGAQPGSTALQTTCIQSAIDRAGAVGGGTVLVPAGVYRVGTLFLRDRVTLHLDSGAVLQGSHDIADYPAVPGGDGKDRQPHHLLVLDGLTHAGITGSGVIDGQGEAFWEARPSIPGWAGGPNMWYRVPGPRPSPLIECSRCTDLKLADFSILNSPGWTLHLNDCERVSVRGITIRNHPWGPNTDGIDVNNSRDITIADCNISAADDAIVLKTTAPNRPTERVAVTNCILRTKCVALKLGTESHSDMRQITFSNCICHDCHRAVGLYCLDGSTFEDIVVSNLVCSDATQIPLNRPIHIDLRRRTDDSPFGTIRRVMIANVMARTSGRVLITAEDGCTLEDLLIQNLALRYDRIEDPAEPSRDARSAQYSNRTPAARAARAAVIVRNARNVQVAGLSIDGPAWRNSPQPFDPLWTEAVTTSQIDLTQIAPRPAPQSADAANRAGG